MDNKTQERRKFKRVDSKFSVFVQEVDLYKQLKISNSSSSVFNGKTLNISANGVLIESNNSFPEKTLLNLSLEMPQWEKYKKSFFSGTITLPSPPFNVTAEVIRFKNRFQSKKTSAVKFRALDTIRANAIDAMVKDYAQEYEPK